MTPDLERLLHGQTTVAGKIRALAAAGYPRADIARILGKRYQHVRNVLEEPQRTTKVAPAMHGLAEGGARPFQHAETKTYRLEVKNGAIALPPEVLEALGTHANGVIIAELGEGTFTLISTMTAIGRIQDWVKTFPASDKLASEELIEERRLEAEKEAREAETWAARRRHDD